MPFRKIGILLLSILFLSGCWDKLEIEKRAYVIGIGMDKGENNMIKITYLIPNPEFGSEANGGGGTAPPKEIITMEANDLISMKNRANTVIAKALTYDQLQFIAVSEELAKDKNFIRYIYDAQKDVEIRRDVRLMITKEDASEYLKNNKPKLELRAHKYLNLIIDHVTQTGLIPSHSQLLQYYRITEAGSDLFLAIYTTSEENKDFNWEDKNKMIAGELPYEGDTNKAQFAGAGVFKDGKMIGKITGDEVRIASILSNTVSPHEVLFSFPDPFYKTQQMAVKVSKLYKNKVKMNLKTDKPVIDITVPLTLEILSNHSLTSYDLKKNREALEENLSKDIHKEFTTFIKKTQTEFKAQPFGWSLPARKKFTTLKAYHDYNFPAKYSEMEIRLHLDLRITNYGRQKSIPKIEGVSRN